MFYERRLCDMTDLDCKQTEKLIPQFLKDELDNRTEKKFLNHVDGCSSCLEELSYISCRNVGAFTSNATVRYSGFSSSRSLNKIFKKP